MTLHEPDVSLTDLGLAVECAWFATWLMRHSARCGSLHGWFILFFAATGLAAFLGAIVHGFVPDTQSSGQRYWSDTHQLSVYIDDYHTDLDRLLNAEVTGTEMITELYVPRPALSSFLHRAAEDFRKQPVQLIYGTIRLIDKDEESFLAWAREPWACTVMNLHVDHTANGITKAMEDFRRLIDLAIAHDGSYFLTYHRWANRYQVERCFPQMPEFLKFKRRYDPDNVYVSDWYRHYKEMFADRL